MAVLGPENPPKRLSNDTASWILLACWIVLGLYLLAPTMVALYLWARELPVPEQLAKQVHDSGYFIFATLFLLLRERT